MAWMSRQFRLRGGLNQEDPIYTMDPGAMEFGQNYECRIGGGYRRIKGYEVYDGTTHVPSLATYSVLPFSGGGILSIDANTTLVGGTSGATATTAGDAALASGTWADRTAAGLIALQDYNRTGTFLPGENLLSGVVVVATVSGLLYPGSLEDTNRKNWLAGARDGMRSAVLTVPGSGSILGVCLYNNIVYAFRNNAGGTAAVMWKSGASAWTTVPLGSYLRYTSGTITPAEGSTVVGNTSGAQATITRVSIGAGNPAGPTFMSGRYALSGITGTFSNGEILSVSAIPVAVAVGTQQVNAPLPGGRYEFTLDNFYGATNLKRMYGCDGVNRAFEFDGTVFCSIETGMTTDTPNHIESHRNHLFLGFPGGSLQNSGTGTPLTWAPRVGAGEIGLGDDITNIISNGNNTLVITTRHRLMILYGTSNLDWNLRPNATSIGAVPFTAQEVGATTLALDAANVNFIMPAYTFGDFALTPISRNIRKIINAKGATTVASLVYTKEGHYYLFFGDKTALVATFLGTELQGWALLNYNDQFSCACSGTDANNKERVFVGTTDGKVMELNSGQSFNGVAIESVLQLPFNYTGSADKNKRFRKLTLETESPGAIDLRVITDFNYGKEGLSGQFAKTTSPTGALWDTALWNQFYWDSGVVDAPEINIDGVGANLGVTIWHKDAVDEPFSLQSLLVQWTPMGVRR